MPANAQLLIILAALLLFWLIVMRPARTAQKRTRAVQANLEPGARVVISAGLFGTIRSVEDDQVELEIAPGTVVRVVRQVVVRRVDEVDEAGDADEATDVPDETEE